jgi:F-box protein 9
LQEDLAPIQRLFPEELIINFFSRLGPYNLGKAACVCKQWKQYSEVGTAFCQVQQ